MVNPPGSDSRLAAFEQALTLAVLADGRSTLLNAMPDDAARQFIDTLRPLGISIQHDAERCRVEIAGTGGYLPQADIELAVGDLPQRFTLIAALCAAGRGRYTVSGEVSALAPRMPIARLADVLLDVGASVALDEAGAGMALNIGAGTLRGGRTHLPAEAPAFLLQATLLVAPLAIDDIFIEDAAGHDVADTLTLIDRFGVSVIQDGGRYIVAAPQRYRGTTVAL